MNAIEFLKSKYIKGEEKNWKPENLEAMASFMDAYAKHQNNELKNYAVHYAMCNILYDDNANCSCGLDELLTGL